MNDRFDINANGLVKTGDIVKVNVFAVGRKGDGIGKLIERRLEDIKDFRIIVVNGKINEVYNVRLTVYENFAIGEIVEEEEKDD